MRSCILSVTIAFFLSSCLKQSIPEAMLGDKNPGKAKVTATFSYKKNGTPVSLTVDDVANQSSVPYRSLACIKKPGYYSLEAVTSVGEFNFWLRTDSLTAGNYKHTGADGEIFVMNYINTAEFIHAPSDNMSFNITSYNNGYISGNFSGLLTPMVSFGTPIIFGAPGSVAITNGVFENVPVIY